MLTNTCSRVDNLGSQFSLAFPIYLKNKPLHVPKRLKQTFPHEYKFGLNLTLPCPVVVRLTFGGEFGYVSSKYISNSNI